MAMLGNCTMQEWGAHPSYPSPSHLGPAHLPVTWHMTYDSTCIHHVAPFQCHRTRHRLPSPHLCSHKTRFRIQSVLWEDEGTALHTG